MNIAGMLERSARQYPDRPAVSLGARALWSYRDLAQRVRAIAGGLKQLGIWPGDRVGIMMPNRPEYLELLFGVWHAGACVVPINARLHSKEAAYILSSAEAKVFFGAAGTIEGVAASRSELPALRVLIDVSGGEYHRLIGSAAVGIQDVAITDPAWLFYTSGTTGRPKGATLSHRNLMQMALSHYADIDQLTSLDTMIHAAPLSHGCGLWSIAAVGRATNNVVLESPSYDPDEVCTRLTQWPNVSMYHAPTMLKRLVGTPALARTDTFNLRTLIYGGSHMYVSDLQRALSALGPKLVQIYGQGESPNTISFLNKSAHADSSHERYLERLGSAGVARSGVEFRVADEEDRPLPSGELGEVLVRGDIVMSGYWRNEEATARSLRDGWLHTGDIGAMDAEGFLTIKDRSKDMIISGGSNIYPREIEEVLLQHPGVLEVSIVGRPHADWGEEVVAFVVPVPGHALREDELDRICLESIARYKRPRHYRFVDGLPKSNYGKILKTELRLLASDTT